jgi:hypothetical protein
MTSPSDHGSDKPRRHRAAPALFAAGLTTAIGGGLLLASVAMIAAGIPMAIAGGKKVPLSSSANGLAPTF